MKNSILKSFSNKVKNQLPPFFQEVVNTTNSDAEADMMLMGAITTISATLPNIYGIYDHNIIYPNLYLFVIAKASAGKGHLNLCKELVKPINKTFPLLIPANIVPLLCTANFGKTMVMV